MSDLIGRFLNFEEHLGRGLVKFVYYVLLFLLVVTTLYDLAVALFGMFTVKFWPNLWQFLVFQPLKFFVALLLLRVGAELIIAVLSIDDSIRGEEASDDTMSSGLNPVSPPKAGPTIKTASPVANDTPPPGTKTFEPEGEPGDQTPS